MRVVKYASFVVFVAAALISSSKQVQGQDCWAYMDSHCEPENIEILFGGYRYGVFFGCTGECSFFEYCCEDLCLANFQTQPTLNDCNPSGIDGACACL